MENSGEILGQGKADFGLTGNGGGESCGNPRSAVEKVDKERLLLLFFSSGIGTIRHCWEKPDLEQVEQGGEGLIVRGSPGREGNVWDGHWETEWGGRAVAVGSTLS